MKRICYKPFFIRLFHWEYWPFHLVYAVIYPYWLWLSIRARSFFFFSAANPTIKNGGFLMESKNEIYALIPQQYIPKTIFISFGSSSGQVREKVRARGLQFPLIAKPDVGLRGIGVEKINNWAELDSYALSSSVDFLVQEFIAFENEAGIFYYRFPNEREGVVSGIVLKEFLQVEGDGISRISELLQKNNRHLLQLKGLGKSNAADLERVLPAGFKEVLLPYGNHSRGTKFIDGSHLINGQISQVIDTVCRQIEGFYYGRLDIRFHSWEELCQGKNFSIIELNGAGSEPAHIYDPKHSLLFAWKEIIRHLNIVYSISQQNKASHPFMKFEEGIKMLRQNASYLRKLREGKTS